MLQLHGIPVPSTALPRVPRDSSSLYSPVASLRPSAGTHPNDQAKEVSNVSFMSSMGSRRIFARNAGSGTVASVHQFHLEDTASTMDAEDDPMQSTSQDMEAAVQVILQEIGEDVERPVSPSLSAAVNCTSKVFCCYFTLHYSIVFLNRNVCFKLSQLQSHLPHQELMSFQSCCTRLVVTLQHTQANMFATSLLLDQALFDSVHCRSSKAQLSATSSCCWHQLVAPNPSLNLITITSSCMHCQQLHCKPAAAAILMLIWVCPSTPRKQSYQTCRSGMCNSRLSVNTICCPSMEQLTLLYCTIQSRSV